MSHLAIAIIVMLLVILATMAWALTAVLRFFRDMINAFIESWKGH